MSANFTPTTAELSLVNQIFAQADKQKLGILTGDVAVKVFGGAKLPGSVLGEIWSLVDEENNGWLSKKGAAMAIRLIAHAQKGEKVSAALVNKPGPLPTIEGYIAIPQQNTGASIPQSPSLAFPPLSPQDKIKYQGIFNRSGPVSGLLTGEKARDIFLKSQLSNDQLLKIWSLADTRDRGALDAADFAIAMYFIHGLMSKQISFVPATLPPGLYEQAGGLTSNQPSITTHLSGNNGSLSPVTSNFGRIQPQYTGQSQVLGPDLTGSSLQPRAPILPARPVVDPFRPTTVARGATHDAWDVDANEKAESDAIFNSKLDTNRVGYIEGDIAVPFMVLSQLPSEELAQIWDLADINSDGRLTRDGFAIAYHLIKKRLAGQPLPVELPPSLIPPSMRGKPPFPASPPQHEPVRDLLDFDETPPASAVSPQATGTLPALQSQSTGTTAVPHIPPRNNVSDPFASSPFSSTPFTPVPNQDLLGEHEGHPQAVSPPLQDQSAEIGNLKNQLQSTNRSLDAVKTERANLESTLASQAAELSALQTQLSSAKVAYDTETILLSQLKERYTTQSNEVQKTKEELIHSESDLSAIRVEKAEIEQALLHDKEEARDLHKRMVDAGQQADQLKIEVEKARREAKQQKGRLAIARKQLSTKENEKAKAEKELEDAATEVKSILQETEDVEAQLDKLNDQPAPERTTSPDSVAVAAALPLPASLPNSPEPVVLSKSNNPFERLGMSGSSSPRSQSPFLPFSNVALTSPLIESSEAHNGHVKPESQPSFDDFFGTHEVATVKEPPASIQENGDVVSKNSKSDDVKDVPTSPTTTTDTDQFVTPPTTAHNDARSESPETPTSAAQARFPSVDDVVAHFPPLDDVPNGAAGEKQVREEPTTDLGTQLQEVEGSDSDDSDDDDDSPLAAVAQKVKERADTSAAENSSNGAIVTMPATSTPFHPQPKTSFDDIFGLNGTQAAPTSPAPTTISGGAKSASSPFDISTTAQPPEPSKSNAPADVSAFDEALSGVSPPPSAKPAQFAFDGFEDSFDFNAAGGTQQTISLSSPSVVGPVSTTPIPQTKGTAPLPSFEDIFDRPDATTGPQQQTASLPTTNDITTQVDPVKPTSFDDAFATFDINPSLNLDSSFTSTTSNNTGFTETPSAPHPRAPPASSTPASPKAVDTSSPRPSVNRASSPALPASPPPRMTSPVPRPSTSSKDGHEKLKEVPTRHSKLSIRFPFGKKKNKHQEPMPPPSTLAPPREESYRTITPASDDDVEAVKQITAMGFTRSQAVEALEKYGYDLQRAINSLLQ